jgi:hypothetical protein
MLVPPSTPSGSAREPRMTIMSSSQEPTSDRRPSGHRRTDRPVPQPMGHVRRERRRDAQAQEPPRQRRNRRLASRGVQHHHRTRIDQPVQRQRHQAPCPPSLAVRPYQGVGVFVRRDCGDRRDPDQRTRGRPPDDALRGGHCAPSKSSGQTRMSKGMGYLVQSPGWKNPRPRLMIAPSAMRRRRRSPPGHPPGGAGALNNFDLVMQSLRQPG